MAHRMAFPANRVVPLAIKLFHHGEMRLGPHGAAEQAPPPADASGEAAAPALSGAWIDVFAVDLVPFDGGEQRDLLYVTASFTDPVGRSIELRSTGAVLGDGSQHFGGVGANLYRLEGDRWTYRPLQGWAAFDVRVDGRLTDTRRLGVIEIVHDDRGSSPCAALSVSIQPTHVDDEGRYIELPVRAAQAPGMSGLELSWEGVTYQQAPLLPVRAERGDTLAKIAKEMSVDHELLSMANAGIRSESGPLRPGDLVYVPLLVRAVSPAPKKSHKSVALSWNEIIHGWTTLN